MKNKNFVAFIALAIMLCFALVACTVPHEHSFGAWQQTETEHYRKCSGCDEVERESHTFVGNECSVCGYERASSDEPDTPDNPSTNPDTEEPSYPSDSDKDTEATATLTFESVSGGYEVTGDTGTAEDIVIPAEHNGSPVVSIGESAFAYSRHTADIVSITIPDSVTSIGRNSFYNQDALESVNIGENSKLKRIGSNAFSGCSALTSFYLPAGCNTLGYDATPASFTVDDDDYINSYGEVFNNCGALESFTVAEENTAFASMEGHLVYIGGTHNSGNDKILIRGVNKTEIPTGVTKIGSAAFRKATITELTIPVTLTYIDKYVVQNCAITKIAFEGTSAQWEALIEASSKNWNLGNKEVTITCSDNDVDA